MIKDTLQALILTGGQGTRLRPLTLYTPKPLLPIANLPFLSYPLSSLRKCSVKEVLLLIANSTDPYRDFLKMEKKNGTRILFSQEKEPLGTAGAIKNGENQIQASTFFILNGDVLTDIDFGEMLKFHKEKRSLLTIALIPVKDPSHYGLIRIDSKQRITHFIEKPKHLGKNGNKKHLINAGIYLFDKKLLDLIPAGKPHSTERELFPRCLSEKIPSFGFIAPSSTYWIDIGTPEKYLSANGTMQLKQIKKLKNSIPQKQTTIHPTAKIDPESVIGNGCKIGANSVVRRSVLLNHSTIENDCTLENCILGSHVRIGHHSSIKHSKVIGDHSLLTPFSQI